MSRARSVHPNVVRSLMIHNATSVLRPLPAGGGISILRRRCLLLGSELVQHDTLASEYVF